MYTNTHTHIYIYKSMPQRENMFHANAKPQRSRGISELQHPTSSASHARLLRMGDAMAKIGSCEAKT